MHLAVFEIEHPRLDHRRTDLSDYRGYSLHQVCAVAHSAIISSALDCDFDGGCRIVWSCSQIRHHAVSVYWLATSSSELDVRIAALRCGDRGRRTPYAPVELEPSHQQVAQRGSQ